MPRELPLTQTSTTDPGAHAAGSAASGDLPGGANRTAEPPIQLTPKAIEMAKQKLRAAEAEGVEGVVGLRVGVRGGGCSGLAYAFDFATKVRPNRDRVLDFDGLTIVVDDRSLKFLEGSTLDWETRLMGYGFKWLNPHAKAGCGCGESFRV
jgi:iron-sulfur cluster assembly protein